MGRLLYLTHTRPYIEFVVHTLSQFVYSPCNSHLKVAQHLLGYLKQQLCLGPFLDAEPSMKCSGFVDSDYPACVDSRCSVSGFSIFLENSLIFWKSKKQATVSRSTAETEYVSMALGTSELVWLFSLFSNFVNSTASIFLYCDNQATMHIDNNSVFHERTKHIKFDCHFVCDKVHSGFLHLSHVFLCNQLTNLITNRSFNI